MTPTYGLIAAFIAFLAWGFGDFAIQRATRSVGTMPAIFSIGAFGSIVLLPFAWNGLGLAVADGRIVSLLALTIFITFVTAMFELEALRRGKIAVIEPVLSFELLITVAIGILIIKEAVTGWQLLFALIVFLGILLTVLRREPKHWWAFWKKNRWLEPGVLLAIFGAIVMSFANIFTGLVSQSTTPVVAIWYIHTALAIVCLFWFIGHRTTKAVFHKIFTNWRPVLTESVLDNAAWLAFAFAVTALPISITIAITESYIALAALLGIIVNRERLQKHQYAGMVIAIMAAIALAIVTGP